MDESEEMGDDKFLRKSDEYFYDRSHGHAVIRASDTEEEYWDRGNDALITRMLKRTISTATRTPIVPQMNAGTRSQFTGGGIMRVSVGESYSGDQTGTRVRSYLPKH